jgi:hypothetical protein
MPRKEDWTQMAACIDFLIAGYKCNELACVRIIEGALLLLQFLGTRDITLGSCDRVPYKTLSGVRENAVRLIAVCLDSLSNSAL